MTEETKQIGIAGRNYPLKLNREDAGVVALAEEMIASKLNLYEKNFSIKDKQDLLAMCLLNFATELVKKQQDLNQFDSLSSELKDTEQYLTNYLNSSVL